MPSTFIWSSPYANSGAEHFAKHLRDLHGKNIESEGQFRKFLIATKERPDIMLIGNFCDDRSAFVRLCREYGINVAFWEDGFFPHYDTMHFDPLGFCWESSLPRMVFRECPDRHRQRARTAREAWMDRACGQLPPGVRKPFVLWPLQLIGDKVNEWDLALTEWTPLLLDFRARLPANFQLVLKAHPRAAAKDTAGIDMLASELGNTLLLSRDADLASLLRECNAVAGANSSVLYEARLMHFKPVFTYARSWFTNHDELFIPLKHGALRPLPGIDWLENPARMRTERLDDYTDWFLAQLMGRQISREIGEKHPANFRESIWRLSYQSLLENGDSIFDG